MSDDRLYDLLPAIHRTRDAPLGYPLRTLLRAVAAQADALDSSVDRQYANWFIETCDVRLIPYFADLVGLSLGPTAGIGDDDARRREVADAIGDRTRKGTFAVLEKLAADATGWPARAVEHASLVMTTASARFPDLRPRRLISARNGEALERLGTPLSDAAALVDVRSVSSPRTRGAGNLPSTVVAVWRLVADGVSRSAACPIHGDRDHAGGAPGPRYTFDPLGRDTPLCIAPTPRAPGATPASDLDVPVPISRVGLERRLDDYYGPQRSLCIYRGSRPVARAEIRVADLADWRAPRRQDELGVRVDPVLGRIALPPQRETPAGELNVSFSRLAVGGIGGGHYSRQLTPPDGSAATYRVSRSGGGASRTIGAALSAWSAARRSGTGITAVIEIADDGVYEETIELSIYPGEQIEIRAAQGCRPVIRPAAAQVEQPACLLRVVGHATPRAELEHAGTHPPAPSPASTPRQSATATRQPARAPAPIPRPAPGHAPRPTVTLDGIWLAGPVELAGRLGHVAFRHCTLVPAAGLRQLGRGAATAASLEVRTSACSVSIDSCVVGRVRVVAREVGTDPVPFAVADSILDASTGGHPAVGGDGEPAWTAASLVRTTVLGPVSVHQVDLVQDSLITGRLDCERQQVGDVRFSYVPPGSRTPRRTSCEPDIVLAELDEAVVNGRLQAVDAARARRVALARVDPRFDEVRFGDPAYARLADDAPPELRRGASDEGELGAYHDRWQHQRADDLRRRLAEFAPVGTDIDILFAS